MTPSITNKCLWQCDSRPASRRTLRQTAIPIDLTLMLNAGKMRVSPCDEPRFMQGEDCSIPVHERPRDASAAAMCFKRLPVLWT